MRIVPAPWHFSHRPPLTLKENLPGLVPLGPGLGKLREKGPDGAEETDVRGRVGARRAADRALVDVDDLVDLLGSFDGRVGALRKARPVDAVGKRRDTAGPRGAWTCPSRKPR